MVTEQESMTTTAGQGDGQQLKKQSSRTNGSLSLHKTSYVMLTVGTSTVSFSVFVQFYLFFFHLYIQLNRITFAMKLEPNKLLTAIYSQNHFKFTEKDSLFHAYINHRKLILITEHVEK